jgi:GrpB-like predicted nucleotidyltransferase (UPF0157 family)
VSATRGPDDVARAIEQPVALSDPDAAWPAMFEAERRRLMDVLPGTFVAIEHIGSTAVAGLRSKPLIDMLAGVRSMAEAVAVNGLIDRIGYTTSAALNATLATRQWFMRQSGGVRTHHLHVVVHGSPDWTARIAFRDRLRADAALRTRYLALKEDLAVRHAGDREAYTEGKSDFINGVIGCRETR